MDKETALLIAQIMQVVSSGVPKIVPSLIRPSKVEVLKDATKATLLLRETTPGKTIIHLRGPIQRITPEIITVRGIPLTPDFYTGFLAAKATIERDIDRILATTAGAIRGPSSTPRIRPLPTPRLTDPTQYPQLVTKMLETATVWATGNTWHTPGDLGLSLRYDATAGVQEAAITGLINAGRAIKEAHESNELEYHGKYAVIPRKMLESLTAPEELDFLKASGIVHLGRDDAYVDLPRLTGTLGAIRLMPMDMVTKDHPYTTASWTPLAIGVLEAAAVGSTAFSNLIYSGLGTDVATIGAARDWMRAYVGDLCAVAEALSGPTIQYQPTTAYPTFPYLATTAGALRTDPTLKEPVTTLIGGLSPVIAGRTGSIGTALTPNPNTEWIIPTPSGRTCRTYWGWVKNRLDLITSGIQAWDNPADRAAFAAGALTRFLYELPQFALRAAWSLIKDVPKKPGQGSSGPLLTEAGSQGDPTNTTRNFIIKWAGKVAKVAGKKLGKLSLFLGKFALKHLQKISWIPYLLYTYAQQVFSNGFWRMVTVWSSAVFQFVFYTLKGMEVTILEDLNQAMRWVWNRILQLNYSFAMYVTDLLTTFFASGFYSMVEFVTMTQLAYAYCCVWPECPSPSREQKEIEDCKPEQPKEPKRPVWDCVIEGAIQLLADYYHAIADTYRRLLEEGQDWVDWRDPLPRTWRVEPAAFPMSALILWQILVNGAWVWAVQIYGIMAGISLASALRDAWRWVMGYEDANHGFLPVAYPFFRRRDEAVRYWGGGPGKEAKRAYREYGVRITGIRFDWPSEEDIDLFLKVAATLARKKWGVDDLKDALGEWLGEKGGRRKLPSKKFLRAIHPASSEGIFGADKDEIADVITAYLMAFYTLVRAARKANRDRRPHSVTSGFKFNRTLEFSVLAALIGWVYGYYGFMAIGQGKLHGKFDPKYAKLCQKLVKAVLELRDFADEWSQFKSFTDRPLDWPKTGDKRADRILRLAAFILHSWINWRIYGTTRFTVKIKRLARKKDLITNDRVLLTGTCGTDITHGRAPECVDRTTTGVIFLAAHSFHRFITPIIKKLAGREKKTLRVLKRKHGYAVEWATIAMPYYSLEPLINDETPFSTLAEPDTLIRRLRELIEGNKAHRKPGSTEQSRRVSEEGALRYRVPKIAKHWWTRVGTTQPDADGERWLTYLPNPDEIISRFKERRPFSLLAAWGEIKREIVERPFHCDVEESGDEASTEGTVAEAVEDVPDVVNADWNVNEGFTEVSPKPPEPPQPPQPPRIQDMIPNYQPPQFPNLKCPYDPPQPPRPSHRWFQPPQPPQIEPPEWNPPEAKYPSNPPKFDPPEFPKDVTAQAVRQYLHDYFCNIVKYSGDLLLWYAKLVEWALNGAPSWGVEFVKSIVGYVKRLLQFVPRAALQYLRYAREVLQWAWDLPRYLVNLIGDYLSWAEGMATWFFHMLTWAFRCFVWWMTKAPMKVVRWLDEIMRWVRKMLDPSAWDRIINSLKKYLRDLDRYVKDLIEWARDYAKWARDYFGSLALGGMQFLRDTTNTAAQKFKQVWKWYGEQGEPLYLLSSWFSSFVEQYCGPDVLNSWRSALYTLMNLPALAPPHNNEVLKMYTGQGRGLLAYAIGEILRAAEEAERRGGKDISRQLRRIAEDITHVFKHWNDPHYIGTQLHRLLTRLNTWIAVMEVRSSVDYAHAIDLAKRASELLSKYLEGGYHHWESWTPKWPGLPKTMEPVARKVGPVVGDIVPAAEDRDGEPEGKIVGVMEVIHDLFIERFDVLSPTFDLVGPLTVLRRAEEGAPVSEWLYPPSVSVSPPDSRLEVVRIEVSPEWRWSATYWARFYHLNEWAPLITFEWPMNILHTHPSDWDVFGEREYRSLAEALDDLRKRYEAARATAEFLDQLHEYHRRLKEALIQFEEAYNKLSTTEFYLRVNREILLAYRWWARETGHQKPGDEFWEAYLDRCREHNKQVEQFNTLVNEYNQLVEELERTAGEAWSAIYDLMSQS